MSQKIFVMIAEKIKKLFYGNTNFESIMTEKYRIFKRIVGFQGVLKMI